MRTFPPMSVGDSTPGRTRARYNRREFAAALAVAAAGAATGCHSLGGGREEIIDCHTHFYDPTRPQGVPWPGKGETQLYRRVLPADYKALAMPHGVTGTVVVEASAWLEDNEWVLDLAKAETFLKGFVGHLNPGDGEFAWQVKRFARHRLFRGIRVSGNDVATLTQTQKLRDLRMLADHDLSLDVNGGVPSLPEVAALARAVPQLRIIIDHVANVHIDGHAPPENWRDGMSAAGQQTNVLCKVSGLVEGSGQRPAAPRDLNFYRPVLDHVWHCFGTDRVIYGSNWPVSELFASFATVHGIVQSYFAEKGASASRKYFADNARTAYRWVRR